jgi:hypothetical protein
MRTYLTLRALARWFARPGPHQLLLVVSLLLGLALNDLRVAGATFLAGQAIVRVVSGRRREEAADLDGDGAFGANLTHASPQSLHVLASAGACGGDTQ